MRGRLRLPVCALALVLTAPAARAECPDPALPVPAAEAVTGTELWTPRSYEVAAGGAHPVPCEGWASAADILPDGVAPRWPTIAIALTRMDPHLLEVRVAGRCGPILIGQAPSGAWFAGARDDEEPTLETALLFAPGNGLLKLWIGAREVEGCAATVWLETFDH